MLSIDPKNTRVVLIGTSRFDKDPNLIPLPGVDGNIRDLVKVLADPKIVGVPRRNIVCLENRKYTQQVAEKLAQVARAAENTLIVYYSGHGEIDGSPPQLYLTLSGTTTKDLQFNGLSIETVRQAIDQSSAQKKIIILDCCYGGRGLRNLMTDESNLIQNRLDLKGTYALAAAPANREAIAPPGEEHTAFTGELLRVLAEGIDNNNEGITLKDVFEHIRAEFRGRTGLPEPQQKNVQDGEDIVIAHNMRHASRKRLAPRIMQGLGVLRARIEAAKIPAAVPDMTLNIATWNIREFGSRRRRTEAAIHYISDIIRQFSIVHVNEVGEDLGDLERTRQILGSHWLPLFSDTNRSPGGNRDRVAYLYDSRALTFTGLAAQADPPGVKDRETGEYIPAISWWRQPYMASFRAGNLDFILLTAYIRWGGPTDASFLPPVRVLVDWVDRISRRKQAIDKDIILIGDFRIPKVDDGLFEALTKNGLTIPDALRGFDGANLAQNKRYDQILHYHRHTGTFTDKGGVLDFYCNDWRALFPAKYYPNMTKMAFTHQLSDHYPLWVQIDTSAHE